MSVTSFSGQDHNGIVTQHGMSRLGSGHILFIEDFRSPAISMWNDGLGGASRDCDITFAGLPTLRLDPQGNASGGLTNPGRTAVTTGVVVKRRIHDGFTGKFGIEAWFRLTSLNLTSNAFLAMSLYNRDGTNAYHGRIWLDPNGNNQPMVGRILDGAASNTLSGTNGSGTAVYTAVTTSVLQNGGGTHTYDPPTGRLDRAGGWHYVKLVVDMAAKRYVSVQLDGQAPVDISAYQMDTTTSAGFAGMHFSFEFAATTSTARFVNIAQVIGTAE